LTFADDVDVNQAKLGETQAETPRRTMNTFGKMAAESTPLKSHFMRPVAGKATSLLAS